MSMFACEALTCVHGCSLCAFTTKQITQVDFGNTTFGNMCTLKDIQSKRITFFPPTSALQQISAPASLYSDLYRKRVKANQSLRGALTCQSIRL